MLIYVYHLARKRKEKSENGTFCAHLQSASSHASSRNEPKQWQQLCRSGLAGIELLLYGQQETEGGKMK